MVMAADLSVRLGRMPATDMAVLVQAIEAAGLPVKAPQWPVDDYLRYMSIDKKADRGTPVSWCSTVWARLPPPAPTRHWCERSSPLTWGDVPGNLAQHRSFRGLRHCHVFMTRASYVSCAHV